MEFDLPLIWFGIIIFATLMYIVMDGFDLGIGILFPFIHNEDDRDIMVNTVAPVWDGNETWLVLGGASLLGAFPLAYAIVLEALTIPLLIMLLALIFRGVAFEFRFKSGAEAKPFWDKAFMFGSITATFSQGVVLGAFISGISVSEQQFSGGSFDWLTPFSLFCGFGLMLAYALLGATWLVKKCQGELKTTMQQLGRALISIWPHIIPPNINLWQAAAPDSSLSFMLVGALMIIPLILVYTFWSYYVFRGKVTKDAGYH